MTSGCSIHGLQKKTRACSTWAGAIFFVFTFHLLTAQNIVTFEASIAAKEVIVGVPFELSFTLKNADGTRFTAPNFSGFKKGAVSEMRGMSFVNGRSSSSQTWSLELTATKPGTFSIGPATVVAEGRTLSTKPLTIKVLSSPSGNKGKVNVPPGADNQVFVAAEFDRDEAYVGQQITWRIRLYTQLSVEGYDIIALPSFEAFFSKEKIRYDKRVEYISIRGEKYAVRTLHEEALFPQETGELNIGPARVSVGIEQAGPQGFLFGPKPVTLQTEAVVLSVKPLPQPPPAEFTGAVGSYEWNVRADTSALTTDDALTITVEVKGSGDTRRFAPPKIMVPPNCEIFEARILEEEEYESESGILHRKKFEYVVLPKDTGRQEINPVLAYFDVDSNRYRELRTESITFTVTPGINYLSPNAPETPLAEPSGAQQPGLLERITDWLTSPLFWGVLALTILSVGIYALLKKRTPAYPTSNSTRPSAHVPVASAPVNQAGKLAFARERFNQAGQMINSGTPKQFYEALFKSLQTWLSAKFGLHPAQMNGIDISSLLLQRGATPIRVQTFISVWHTCEQSVYGGQAQTEQMVSTWQIVGQVLEALEVEIR